MNESTIKLAPREILQLQAANRYLTRATERHHHSCECVLCEARMLTDTQDGPRDGWLVPGVTLEGAEVEPDVVT
jgi:hypothetical protein